MADQVLDITIISAKHIKNVNWRHGDLKPYAIFSLTNFSGCNPTKRTTDSKSIKPVWNEHFVMPLTSMPSYAVFTLSIHHTTACSYEYLNRPVKPLVGTFQVRLCDLPDPGNSDMIRTFDLVRPSGRPNGKVRLKLGVRECALSPPRALIKPSLPWWDPESDLPIPLPDGILIEPQCVVKIKELEDDDDDDDDEKSVGKLAPSRWYYKLKKLVYVYIKKRKGPPDPVPIDPKHMWYLI